MGDCDQHAGSVAGRPNQAPDRVGQAVAGGRQAAGGGAPAERSGSTRELRQESVLGCRRPVTAGHPLFCTMETYRRGNYDSGRDYVLEYGDLRFTFNERDFAERVEQAALKLGFVATRLDGPELEDLVNLA